MLAVLPTTNRDIAVQSKRDSFCKKSDEYTYFGTQRSSVDGV